MAFRYLIVDTSGDVTGTDEAPPVISDSDTIVCVIDTAQGSYCNDDEDDIAVEQWEAGSEPDYEDDH